MLSRWLLAFALTCGMLFAPMAMAFACPHQAKADQAVSHCAGQGDTDQRVPAKQVQCMGACSGIEVAAARLAAPMVPLGASSPIPTEASLSGILIERDTPPPRLS